MLTNSRPRDCRWKEAPIWAASVGRVQARAERHEELEPLRDLAQHGGGDPGVLAQGSRRRQRAFEAQLLGGPGDLAEIGDRRLPAMRHHSLGRPVAAPDDVPAVAGRG